MILSTVRQLFAFRAFLVRRLVRYSIAELMFRTARRAPFPLNNMLYERTCIWNPMHIPAALERARWLTVRHDPRASAAFQFAEQIIENRQRVSASDLALMQFPARLTQKIVRQNDSASAASYDKWLDLAQQHGEQPSASRIRQPAPGNHVSVHDAWHEIQAQWSHENFWDALARAAPFIERGDFVSPLDALTWAERFIQHRPSERSDDLRRSEESLAERCLDWAQEWTPERAQLWLLRGELARRRGQRADAIRLLERAACLDPEDISIFLARQKIERGAPLCESKTIRMNIRAPAEMELGATAVLDCVLENAIGEWTIHYLPPAGWGIVTEPRTQRVNANRRCAFQVRACRPHRVRGAPWTLTFVAVGGDEYVIARAIVRVPDRAPGRLFVLVTEDHELWEERGVLARADVENLLVEKSTFASAHFAPWTHMVEVGSALALFDWAAEQDVGWRAACDRVREHLAEELVKGNDIQPHLHAFSMPAAKEFPYKLAGDVISVDKKFLLTAEEERRDFARALPPPQRIAAVADAVARLEEIARGIEPDYRAVLWRSGQLEFGESAAERAWSGVALLRAGLFADSDLSKKTWASSVALTAFSAALEEPLVPKYGGEILQLPIANNLEGDFLHDARTLCAVAKRTGDALRQKPGVHLVTLLTHDKFINARRGADEFCLDEHYNDWQTVHGHLDAWRDAGAVRVTAREAIATLLDDATWQLRAWLMNARVNPAGTRARYAVKLLGKDIPISEEYPQAVLVTIPPSLRARVRGVRVWQGGRELEVEGNPPHAFWLCLTARTPESECEFEFVSALVAMDAEMHAQATSVLAL